MVNSLSQVHACHCSSHANAECIPDIWGRYSWHLSLLLDSVWAVFAGQTKQKSPLCKKHIPPAELSRKDDLLLQRARDKQPSVWGFSFVPNPLAYIPLTLYLLEIFSKLFVYCLSVYKHTAEITSKLPFLLPLLFVFIHAPCLRHLPYCTDHHTVFLN